MQSLLYHFVTNYVIFLKLCGRYSWICLTVLRLQTSSTKLQIYPSLVLKLVLNLCCFLLFRLTPSLLFTMMLWNNILPLLITGPSAMFVRNPKVWRTSCNDYWWTNVLYINNFYPKHMMQEVITRPYNYIFFYF